MCIRYNYFYMKRFAVIILLFVVMLAGMSTVFPTNKPVATVIKSGAVSPFGGQIALVKRCDDGLRKWFKLTKLFGDSEFIYVPPPKYLNGEPSHTGQWIIGVAYEMMECEIAKVPVFGKRVFALFGTSL